MSSIEQTITKHIPIFDQHFQQHLTLAKTSFFTIAISPPKRGDVGSNRITNSMKKIFTILLMGCISQSIHAQFFVEVGANAQMLSFKIKESPALGALSGLIAMSGGDPTTTLPKRIKSRTMAPKINIGYRIQFDEFNVLISAGTSQDVNNSFRLRGTAAVGGKTYPYPEAFSARIRGYKTFAETGLSYGGEFCFDNQKSEMLLSNSNLDVRTLGLINQISSDINLLGNGSTRFMQINALLGWQKSKDNFELGILGLVGVVGKSLGVQLDLKLRYFLGERLRKKNKIHVL